MWGTRGLCSVQRKELRFVLSLLSGKNKGVAKVGHPG